MSGNFKVEVMVSSKPTNAGFTLIELLIVIAITAVLAAIALPKMERMIASQRINNRAEQMLALFQFARAEAIRSNKPVLICPTTIRKNTTDSNGCQNFSAYNEGKGWQGFLAFIDNDINGKYAAAIDSSVRVVALNQNTDDINKIKVKLKWQNYKADQSTYHGNITDGNKLGFLPNGQFGFGKGANDWTIGQSYVVMEVSDSKYPNLSRRVVITPSGKPVLCQNDTSNSFCTVPLP